MAGDAPLAMMVGYFALSALLSVDWGAAVGARRDILRAGFPCVLAASAWTSIVSLVVVSASRAWYSAQAVLETVRSTHCRSLFAGPCFKELKFIPAYASAAILILFGLAASRRRSLALAKYTEVVSDHWPSLGPGLATWIACPIAFVLIATFQVDRLGPIFAQWASSLHLSWAMAGDLLRRNQSRFAFRTGLIRRV